MQCGLLAAQPLDALHSEARPDESQDEHGRAEVGVDETGPTASGGQQVLEGLAVADEVADIVGDGAVDEPEHRQRERPGEQRRALQANRQAQWPAQTWCRDGRPRSRLDETRAPVTPSAQRPSRHEQQHGDRERDEQWPPALTGIWAQLLRPADGREPGQPPVGDVTDRPDGECVPEDQAGQPGRGAAVLGDLRSDEGQRCEDQPDRQERGSERHRADHGQACADQAHRDRGADEQVHPGQDESVPQRCARHVRRRSPAPARCARSPPRPGCSARTSAGSSSATRTSPTVPAWNATCPPTVSRPCTGPLNAIAAAFFADAAAAWSRSAWVWNSPLTDAAVAITSAVSDPTHSTIRSRSRAHGEPHELPGPRQLAHAAAHRVHVPRPPAAREPSAAGSPAYSRRNSSSSVGGWLVSARRPMVGERRASRRPRSSVSTSNGTRDAVDAAGRGRRAAPPGR